jgi:hypothetical protein
MDSIEGFVTNHYHQSVNICIHLLSNQKEVLPDTIWDSIQ